MPTQRIRRRPEEARASILHTAEQLLMAGGPPAVQMRAVAARLGMTDAGVAHHFGSRDELLAALLRHGGRRIRDAVTIATEGWLQRGASVQELIDAIYSVYAGGYGELAIALHAAGWREEGVGMLDGVVDALHNLRPVSKGRRPSRGSTRLASPRCTKRWPPRPPTGRRFGVAPASPSPTPAGPRPNSSGGRRPSPPSCRSPMAACLKTRATASGVNRVADTCWPEPV